mmetsp:Transcript_20604/g.53250  ORF Transcript_20604/g.53250 Transcript_20604/m.53250 type:complete len:238 (+) Transcript_20604:150-863(+)
MRQRTLRDTWRDCRQLYVVTWLKGSTARHLRGVRQRGSAAAPRSPRRHVDGLNHALAAAAAAFALLLSQVDTPVRICFCPWHGLALHAVLDLRRHGEERGLHVVRALCGRLQERHPVLVRKLLRGLKANLARLADREVRLVADQELGHVLARVLVDLDQPIVHAVKRALVGYVVDNDDAVRPAVVCTADRAEALLPRRVPDLQLDGLAIELNRADLEVDADCADVRVHPCVVGEAEQ